LYIYACVKHNLTKISEVITNIQLIITIQNRCDIKQNISAKLKTTLRNIKHLYSAITFKGS